MEVAIVEDTREDLDRLTECLNRYQKENNVALHITAYSNGVVFLENKNVYDIIFMDIKMPYLSGMETARKWRALGEDSCLIFVTNMKQYAIEGYQVRAFDYILKPISYSSFSFKLQKIFEYVNRKKKDDYIIRTKDGLVRLAVGEIMYVEVIKHKLFYHTTSGVMEVWGSMSEAEKSLSDYGFVRCNSCYLVNLKYVTSVNNDYACVGDEMLRISSSKKKEFVNALILSVRGD